ncbi:hypothetical protein COT48_04555, partial [Candidatus Woesearchaeota archaeon CG08_land_8_20_14_0_20_47_9]
NKQSVMKKPGLIWRFAIGVAVLSFLIYRVGFTRVLKTIASVNPLYLLFIPIVYAVSFSIAALNIHLMISVVKKLPYRRVLRYQLLSWSAGLFGPGKIGEFSLVYFLRKEGISLGKGMVIPLLDKVITVAVLAIFAGYGFFIYFGMATAARMLAIIALAIVVLGLVFITGFGRAVIRRLLGRHASHFKGFSKTLRLFLRERRSLLALNMVLTVIKYVVAISAIFLLFLGFGIKVNLPAIMFIDAVATMLALIPVTVSGLGFAESAAVLLYSNMGVDAGAAAGVYLILNAFNYLLAVLLLSLGTGGRELD